MGSRRNRVTVYMLRTRLTDNAKWSEPKEFATRKERDTVAAECRILGGMRTHSYEMKTEPGNAEPS